MHSPQLGLLRVQTVTAAEFALGSLFEEREEEERGEGRAALTRVASPSTIPP